MGNSKRYRWILPATGIVLLLAEMLLSMCVGRYPVALSEVADFLMGKQVDETSWQILYYIRLPRTLVSVLVGMALSLSGTIYQSTFHNRLVSPDLLGVSAGSGVGACLAILLGQGMAVTGTLAFVFGLATVFLTLLLAKAFGRRSEMMLIFAGMATGGLMSSLVGLMKYLADDERKLAEMTFWLLGDLSKTSFQDLFFAFPVVGFCIVLALFLSWRLNILSLGEKEAESLGLSYRLNFLLLISIATILTATAVSIAGTIGWVGLVIPNMARLLAGNNNRKMMPAAILMGGIFMGVTDMLARSLSPGEIPLGVVSGILGTPLFLITIYYRSKNI